MLGWEVLPGKVAGSVVLPQPSKMSVPVTAGMRQMERAASINCWAIISAAVHFPWVETKRNKAATQFVPSRSHIPSSVLQPAEPG